MYPICTTFKFNYIFQIHVQFKFTYEEYVSKSKCEETIIRTLSVKSNNTQIKNFSVYVFFFRSFRQLHSDRNSAILLFEGRLKCNKKVTPSTWHSSVQLIFTQHHIMVQEVHEKKK